MLAEQVTIMGENEGSSTRTARQKVENGSYVSKIAGKSASMGEHLDFNFRGSASCRAESESAPAGTSHGLPGSRHYKPSARLNPYHESPLARHRHGQTAFTEAKD
jgi:hypothetical protein